VILYVLGAGPVPSFIGVFGFVFDRVQSEVLVKAIKESAGSPVEPRGNAVVYGKLMLQTLKDALLRGILFPWLASAQIIRIIVETVAVDI
jgi:hypothetical protein